MISVNDFKTGLTIELDNGLWSVVEFLHVKPGKGAAFVRTKLKNVETGQVVERTFRAGEKVGKATLDRREMQYLYKEGSDYVMMDNETYDQLHIAEAQVGDSKKYLVGEKSTMDVIRMPNSVFEREWWESRNVNADDLKRLALTI